MRSALLPVVRLTRSRGTWAWALGWSLVVLAASWRAQRHGAVHAAAQALDVYATIAVPLLVYALVDVVAPGGLAGSGRALVRLGASPRRVALTTVLVSMVASAFLCGALGAAAVASGHGSADPPIAQDALQTLAFGALGGAAYAAYFMLGSAAVARAWGRGALLVLDWLLGSDDGLGALLTPRAHLRNVLGGTAPFDALPWESLVGLGLLAVVCGALAVRRAGRVRV